MLQARCQGSFKNKTMSSTKRAKRCSLPPIVIPVISADCRIAIAKGLMANTNYNGNMGQPCRVDLHHLKVVEYRLLVKISAIGSIYSNLIHFNNFSPNPNHFKMSKREPHSILSNAFSASNDRIACPYFALQIQYSRTYECCERLVYLGQNHFGHNRLCLEEELCIEFRCHTTLGIWELKMFFLRATLFCFNNREIVAALNVGGRIPYISLPVTIRSRGPSTFHAHQSL